MEQEPVEISLRPVTQSPRPAATVSRQWHWFLLIAIALLVLITGGGLAWFFLAAGSPVGLGWYLFSFAAGLTMIILPCTLPLAFVIVPLSMGKGPAKGFGIAIAFGLGVAITLSLYGVVAAVVGEVAVGTLDAPLETVKNWLYFIAGTFAYIFALGELGLVRWRMPSFTGAAPAFIQKQQDYLKAFLLGLFMGNIGVGCPHPATPVILTSIAVSGSVFYGWLLFFVHAIGRIIPLLVLALLGILGVNALSWVVAKREKIERATGWGMVFVAGFILVLGLFTHDWWELSGSHSFLEKLTQEERFLGVIADRLQTTAPHAHGLAGLEGKTGLFGLPLWFGTWALVILWIIPLMWWYLKEKSKANDILEEKEREARFSTLKVTKWFIVVLTAFILLVFVYVLPHNFRFHWAQDTADEEFDVYARLLVLDPLEAKKLVPLRVVLKDVETEQPLSLMISHERLVHAIIISDNFEYFAHLHPEDFGPIEKQKEKGEYEVRYTFPQPGRYLVAVDAFHEDHEITKQFVLEVGLVTQSVSFLRDLAREKTFNSYTVRLEGPQKIRAGDEVEMRYSFSKNGEPVEDFVPYLGAPMHFAIMSFDLGTFAHTHGELHQNGAYNIDISKWMSFVSRSALANGRDHDSEGHEEGDLLPPKFGPDIFLHYTFPHAGLFVIFGEAKHQDKVILTKFMVEVLPGKEQ